MPLTGDVFFGVCVSGVMQEVFVNKLQVTLDISFNMR